MTGAGSPVPEDLGCGRSAAPSVPTLEGGLRGLGWACALSQASFGPFEAFGCFRTWVLH